MLSSGCGEVRIDMRRLERSENAPEDNDLLPHGWRRRDDICAGHYAGENVSSRVYALQLVSRGGRTPGFK